MRIAQILLFIALCGLLVSVHAATDYKLSPQDKIAVTVLRHAELSQTYVVPPDGVIDFPRAGRLNVAGKSVAEVAIALKLQLAQVLREPEVTVIMADARPKYAYVLGLVAKPGAYPVEPGTRVTELLAAAGDLVGERDRLTLRLVRDGAVLPIDLDGALHGRDPAANLPIREGDVLWAQAPGMIDVVVAGQVRTPGLVRLHEGGRVLDALAAAGDLVGEREKLTAAVTRGKTALPVNLAAVLAGTDPAANLPLQDNDVLLVQAPVKITVVVTGQVRTPGAVKLDAGCRLLDALAAAGDVIGEREKLTAGLTRDGQALPVALQAALGGNATANLALADGDLLLVQAPAKITVAVSGAVKAPGIIKLDDGGTVTDALAMTGDVTDRRERLTLSLLRDGKAETLTWNDLRRPLSSGDVLTVTPEAVMRVYVNGQVKNPGVYELPLNAGVLEAVAVAGGVLANPALGQVTIVRQAGAQERVNLIPALVEGRVGANPRLDNGDQVIVPESTTKVTVLGKVAKPGAYPISDTTPLNVVDAISLAGGSLREAKLSQVAVIRQTNGKTERLAIDVNAVLHKGKFELNLTLLPNDIVYVPAAEKVDWSEVLKGMYQIGILMTL